MSSFEKQYDPHTYEQPIYKKWEDSGSFKPNQQALDEGKDPFVIMLPPPNITGSLHMGHALQDTIMDILTRYHRMKGDPTLWLPGTDHAAIATNKVIEEQLANEGKTRFDIGREAFMEKTEAWHEKTGSEILNQMKRLGTSCDWSRLRFTMDDKYVDAVNAAFIRFYEKGYIYRGERIVNWDPKGQTTVSDLEIDWKTEKAPFYTFKYGPFEIGTARPETKFGDKYVVVHPDDDRYKEYDHGQELELEWINGTITATVIKDEAAVPEFGTGAMTITPWHDTTDFEIAERHNLDKQQIIDFDGKLMDIAGEFTGMTIQEAREKVVKKLDEKGLLVSVDEKYEHNIALNDRGKGVIEPQIMRQWFVDMEKLKKETIEVAQNDVVRFLPPRWKEHFITWMENIIDWNINRQIWLGHRMPVWWKPGTHGTDKEEGNYKISIEKPEGDWEQDPDVLDTWFSTALWPFATLGWPENTSDLQTFYPSTVLVTARDILYLWVARMIFAGLDLMQGDQYDNRQQAQRIPYQDVLIHSVVLAKDGQRMSKSLGTGVDPLELIEEYGADATRFGLMYQMTYDNQAMKFDETAIKNGRNFANKLWNLARFINDLPEKDDPTFADEWIQHRVTKTGKQVGQLINEYKTGEASRAIYDFIWKDYADWYVEILKVKGSTTVAKSVFKDMLKILHPFMPYVTEAIWEKLNEEKLLIQSPWPEYKEDIENRLEMLAFEDIVTTTRSARALLSIPAAETINLYVEESPGIPEAIERLTKSALVTSRQDSMKAFPLLNTNASIYISSDSITQTSIDQAIAKLEKEQTQLEQYITTQTAAVASMQGKAPKEKVEEKQEAINTAKQRLEELKASQEILTQ